MIESLACAVCVDRPAARWDFREDRAYPLCMPCLEPDADDEDLALGERVALRDQRQARNRDWLDRALAILQARPGLTLKQLAPEVGVEPYERLAFRSMVFYAVSTGRLRAEGTALGRRYYVPEEVSACAR